MRWARKRHAREADATETELEPPRGGNARASYPPAAATRSRAQAFNPAHNHQFLAHERAAVGPPPGDRDLADDGTNLEELPTEYFLQRDNYQADEHYILLFVDLIHRRATQHGLVLTMSGRNYMQIAQTDSPELVRHRTWIARPGNHDRLKANGAPRDFRRLLRILRLLDEANSAVLDSPPTSTFAEAGRRLIAGEF